jgi:hypothetical protein
MLEAYAASTWPTSRSWTGLPARVGTRGSTRPAATARPAATEITASIRGRGRHRFWFSEVTTALRELRQHGADLDTDHEQDS